MRINVTRSAMPDYDAFCKEIRELWDTRVLTNNGPKCVQFAGMLREKLCSPNVSLFVNGHLALEALLEAAIPEKAGEVITTPFTFASTTHAIVRRGLTPVFCDIREEDYTLDPALLERLITPNTRAILPVHVYGNLCDHEAISAIAKRHGLPVFYDAAHAFDVSRNGVSSAAIGDAAMFSFHATKVFHSVEGGCICTADASLAARLDLVKNYGIMDAETVVCDGGNAKMNEFQAIMGILNLPLLEENIAQRKAVALTYRERLEGLSGLRLPPVQPGVQSNYSYFPVVFAGGAPVRNAVCAALAEQGIFARKYFYPLTTDFACYRGRPDFDSSLTPVAKRVSEGVCTLPLYPGLPLEEARKIADIVTEVLRRG